MIMSAESEPLADFITTAAYTSGIDEGEVCKGSNGRAEKRIVPFYALTCGSEDKARCGIDTNTSSIAVGLISWSWLGVLIGLLVPCPWADASSTPHVLHQFHPAV